jgi:hypothetical protein
MGPNKSGWEELSRMFGWVASRLSQATYSDFRWDVEVADARGDMGYTVGFERFNHHSEDGEWKIVHRHGDLAPMDESPPPQG